MDCHEEVALLERRLSKLDGVHAIAADVVGQRLRVSHDAVRVGPSAIAEAVAETGMRAWLDHDPRVRAVDPTAFRRLVLLVASGTLLALAGLAHLLVAPRALEVALCVGAIVSGGVFTARRALAAARHLSLDINFLMTVAVAGAIALGQWSEAGSVVFLFALAQWLEARSLDRARHAIRALMDVAPADVTVRRGGALHRLPVDDVAVGDTMVVRPGEKVALDGEVVAGDSDVNQAPVTGESVPVAKTVGDRLFAGSINGHGALDARVTRLGRDSTIARIVQLVERAQAQRAPTQHFVDRFAHYYTPAVIALAGIVAVVPPLAGAGAWSEWIYRALVLLVISCPCALVISTPISIVSALAAAARHGVLIKGGVHLERTAHVRCVAFDKTGTLTTGRLRVTQVVPLNGGSAEELLATAAAIEAHSEHPIGRAIVRQARRTGVTLLPTRGFRALPGRGAEAQVDGVRALVGNHRLFEERQLCTDVLHGQLEALAQEGQTPVIVATGGETVGVVGVGDEVRDTAASTVASLRREGVSHVVMLTGDGRATAMALAEQVGVDETRADLLPEHKVDAIGELRERYGPVAMVGDGVNDAPALAAADVGIAMGVAGSDASLETADVALMADDLAKVPFAIRLGRVTLRNVKTNITVALGLKAAFLVLAVAGEATLWMAVVADMGASLLVVANGLRLLRAK
jgi:Cd2+/Zn2+-exporting ATPase